MNPRESGRAEAGEYLMRGRSRPSPVQFMTMPTSGAMIAPELQNRSALSYVHGASSVPLIFDTIGERLRLAAKLVSAGGDKHPPPLQYPDREFVIFKREGIRKTYKQVLEDVSAPRPC